MIQKFKVKYAKISDAAKASMWFAVCSVIQKGIALLSTPIFTRLMTTEQYGEYTIYQSWYQVISIFATLNLFYGVFNNGMTKYPNDRKRYTSSMQGLSTTITIALFFVYVFAQDFWNRVLGLSSLYIFAMFIELLFVPAFNFWSAKERYDYKYKKLIAVTLIIALASPILGVLTVINTTYKAEARVLSYVFVQVAIGLIFYIYNAVSGKTFYHKEYWKFALAFNIPLIPHYLSSVVLSQADRLMIGSMFGKDKAAIYAVAYSVATIMNIFVLAINNSFTPYMYKSLKNKDTKGIRKNSKILLELMALMCMLAMILGPEVIKIFAAKEYYDAIWVIPPVACAVYFNFLYPLFSVIEFYYEKPKYVMTASVIGAVMNIILNYFFMQIFDYYAAGYTTLACYIMYSFAHYFLASKLCREHEIATELFDIKYILKISFLVLVGMVGATLLYNTTIIRYLVCCMIFVVCGLYVKKNKDVLSKRK